MFKKNTKSILNPSLPNPQPRGPRGSVTTILPTSMPTSTKAPSITKQLLAKFENKYVNKVKEAKSSDSDISDFEPMKGKETEGADEEFTKLASTDVEEEVSYESDFEASDSDVPDNEKSPTVNSQSHLEDENSFLPKNIDEIQITDDSIHENIFTFEELMKNSANQLIDTGKIITNEPDDISELLENEIESIDDNIETTPKQGIELPTQPVVNQSKNCENQSTNTDVVTNKNAIPFSELLSEKGNIMTASENSYDETGCKDSRSAIETFKEVKVESSIYNLEDDKTSSLVKSTRVVNPAKLSLVKEDKEEILNQIMSSPTKLLSTGHVEKAYQEKEHRPKPKSKWRSSRHSLEEKRRLERMFFLVEKQSLKGVVEQPVFSPLAMSWEKEAETTEASFESRLASPEDAFAEMLRLRLRVTRNKMTAEYAAYRSCCAAVQILASSHQPVTLAATKQIIAQLKQPDRPEPTT